MVEVHNCKTCKFWCKINDAYGMCRRYPPMIPPSHMDTTSVFPTTRDNMWCGEYTRGALNE